MYRLNKLYQNSGDHQGTPTLLGVLFVKAPPPRGGGSSGWNRTQRWLGKLCLGWEDQKFFFRPKSGSEDSDPRNIWMVCLINLRLLLKNRMALRCAPSRLGVIRLSDWSWQQARGKGMILGSYWCWWPNLVPCLVPCWTLRSSGRWLMVIPEIWENFIPIPEKSGMIFQDEPWRLHSWTFCKGPHKWSWPTSRILALFLANVNFIEAKHMVL